MPPGKRTAGYFQWESLMLVSATETAFDRIARIVSQADFAQGAARLY